MSFVALLLAAAAVGEPPICTDRPAKANTVCTVPAGRVQLESSAFGWSRLADDGAETETLTAGSSVIKFGLNGRSDLQIGFTPFVRVTSAGDSISGIGDVVVRYKLRLTNDSAPVQVALIPFAKAPTARHGIGNGKLEGGIAAPISVAAGALMVTLGPEADLLADADGHGRHLALVNLVNLSGTVAPGLTLSGELWSNLNFDPDGTVRQASADASLAYSASNDLQLDVGVNAGLTDETPDIEVYGGVSVRF